MERRDLVSLVYRIMDSTSMSEAERDELIDRFDASVPRPRASDLIIFGAQADDGSARELSPEQIVDLALAYKPA